MAAAVESRLVELADREAALRFLSREPVANLFLLDLAALAGHVALDLLIDLGLDEATAEIGRDQGGEIMADDPDAPGERHDQGRSESGDEEQKDAHRAVGHEVPGERHLQVGAAPRLAIGALLRGQSRTATPSPRLDFRRPSLPVLRHGAAPKVDLAGPREIMGGSHSDSYHGHTRR